MRHSLKLGWTNFRVLAIDMRHRLARHWRFPALVFMTTLLGCAYVWEHTYYLELASRVDRAGRDLDLLTKINKQTQWEISSLDQRGRIHEIAATHCSYQVIPMEGIVTLHTPRPAAPVQAETAWTTRLVAQVLATEKSTIN